MGKKNGRVKFGLKNVHYAPITEDEDGGLVFGTPVAIPGAVSLTMDTQGDETEFEADDSLYYVSYAYTGKKGTLEMAKIPDQFRKDILREIENPTNHVLFEDASAEPVPFALLFEVGGNARPERFVWYYSTVSRPSENASTTGKTKTPQTESMSLSAIPLSSGIVRARTTDKTPDDVYNGWFKSVLAPDVGDTSEPSAPVPESDTTFISAQSADADVPARQALPPAQEV